MASVSVIDGTIQRKVCERGVSRAGKGITLNISSKNNDGFNKIIKSLENPGVLNDGSSKTGKHEITRNKKTRRRFFFFFLLRTSGASMLGNALTGKGIMRAGKRVMRATKGYSMDHMDKDF